MKKQKILFILCFIAILSGCGSNKISGKYESMDDVVLELYDNGECYYEKGRYAKDSCSYNVTDDNQIRIEYSDYNVISERTETSHETFEIQDNGNLADKYGEILYKK